MDKSIISTQILMKAISYYSFEEGFNPIEVPMVVESSSARLITPPDKPLLYHNDNQVYTGSVEQSFIQLYKENRLLEGKFMAIAPCYRYDSCHNDKTYAIYLELGLIHIEDALKLQYLNSMIEICRDFF